MAKYGLALGVLSKIVEMGKVFLLTIIAGRLLSITEFGVYSLLLSIAAIVAILAEFRIQDVVYRNINRGDSLTVIIGNSLVIVALFAFIGHLLLIVISYSNYFSGSGVDIYFLYGFIFYLNIARVFKTVMIANGKSLLILVLEVISGITAACYLFFFSASAGVTVNNIVTTRIVDLLVLSALLIFITLAKKEISLPSRIYMVTLIKETFPLVLSGVAVILYQKIDQLMIKHIMGYDALGLYSANLTVVTMFSILPMMYAQVASKSIHVDGSDFNILRYVRAVSYIGLSLSLLIFVFGDSVVYYGFGLRYQIDSGIWYSLALIPFLISTGAAATQVLIAKNRQSYVWIKSFIALGVNMVLNYFMIPIYGMEGAAVATVVSLLFGNVISNLLIKSYRDIFTIQIKSLVYYW